MAFPKRICGTFTTLNSRDFVEQFERVLRFSSDSSNLLVAGIFEKICVQKFTVRQKFSNTFGTITDKFCIKTLLELKLSNRDRNTNPFNLIIVTQRI